MKMHNLFSKKLIPLSLAIAISTSAIGMASVIPVHAIVSPEEVVSDAAKQYVESSKNNSSKEGLLEAVNSALVASGINEKAFYGDLYIKYSVPSVTDTDISVYKLEINGSDGAVVAEFDIGNKKIYFADAFRQESEVIKTDIVAVVGGQNNNKLVFDKLTGNVIGCNSAIEKIVIPTSSKVTMGIVDFGKYPLMNNVKVVVIEDTQVNLLKDSFNGNWNSLVALSIFDKCNFLWKGRDPFVWGSVQNLDNLKYLRLPETGETYHESNTCYNVPKLENTNVPMSQTYGWECFCYTNVREYVLAGYSNYRNQYHYAGMVGNSSFKYSSSPNTNITQKETKVKFSHIASLIYAAVNEQLYNGVPIKAALKNAKSTVKGEAWTEDCEKYIDKINIKTSDSSSSDTFLKTTITVTDSKSSVSMDFLMAKALKMLDVGFDMVPSFSPDIKDYSITVPNSVMELDINTVPTAGAEAKKIINNKDFIAGDVNIVTINVTNTEGKNVDYTISVIRSTTYNLATEIREAAKKYVETNKNLVTKDGLLEAVNEITADKVELDSDNFYIKHSVPSVTDIIADGAENKYPLDIKGSDGAMAAIFTVNGNRVGVAVTFPQEKEVISIKCVSVLNKNNKDFKFDINGNVISYNGSADKIVIPSGFCGSIAKISDMSSANHVSVAIINNDTPLCDKAFSEWNSLRAVQFNNSKNGSKMFDADCSSQFMGCEKLKYVKLPDSIDRNGGNGAWFVGFGDKSFTNCNQLENVIFPKNGSSDRLSFYYSAFTGTAIREFILPERWNFSFDDYLHQTCLKEGTTNITVDTTKMTFAHAASLAASKASEYVNYAEGDVKTISTSMKSAVKGTDDSKSFASKLKCIVREDKTVSDSYSLLNISIIKGDDEVVFDLSCSKTLLDLTVDNYTLYPKFKYDIKEYDLKVAYDTTSVNIKAILANGAKLGTIEGSTDISVGKNTILIPVITIDNKVIHYKLNVERVTNYTFEMLEDLMNKVLSKKDWTNSDNQSSVIDLLKEATAVSGYELTVNDFYKYKAIGGAREPEEILVTGHNGYISLVINAKRGEKSKKIPIRLVIKAPYKVYTFEKNEISKRDEFLLSNNGKKLVGYDGNAKKIVIPDGVEEILPYWFYGDYAEKVIAIIMPESVRKIPTLFANTMTSLEVCRLSNNITDMSSGAAFYECYMLTYVHLPERLEGIGSQTFTYDLGLPWLHIPDSVTEIRNSAFWNTGVREITLSANMTYLDADAITYPSPYADIWQRPDAFPSEEYRTRLQKQMDNFEISTSNLKITVLSNDLFVLNASSIGADETHKIGESTYVHCSPKIAKYVFDGVENDNVTYDYTLDMKISEAISRVSYKSDSLWLTNDSDKESILETLRNAIDSTTVTVDWKTDLEFKKATSDNIGRAVGIVTVTDGTLSYDIDIDSKVNYITEPAYDNTNGENNNDPFKESTDKYDNNSYYEHLNDSSSPKTGEKNTVFIVSMLSIISLGVLIIISKCVKQKTKLNNEYSSPNRNIFRGIIIKK